MRTLKIRNLREFKHERVCELLKDLLHSDESSWIRAACARELRPYASDRPDAADGLLKHLNTDKSDDVRAACAEALVDVAPIRSDVADCLKTLLGSANDQIRCGAVRGLARAAHGDQLLFNSLLRIARDKSEPIPIRIDCLDAVDRSRGSSTEVEECFLDCLHDASTPVLQRVVTEILARALVEDRWPWSQELVAMIEGRMMEANGANLSALEQLVNAREIRGGPRLEQILNAALAPFNDRIVLAFVFGSVARRQQDRDSDIDLLIIGNVRLKELSPGLHSLEKTLGRVVNPVLFSLEQFRAQYREGNPFLLDVVRKDKIFLKGSRDELTNLVADRSPE